MPWSHTRNLSVLVARAHPPASSSSSTIWGKSQHFPSVVGLPMATEERCVSLLGVLSSWCGRAIQGSAHSMGQFIGGRFVLGFGAALASAAGPAYTVELAHPAYR